MKELGRRIGWFIIIVILLAACRKRQTASEAIISRYATEQEREARELFKRQSDRWPREVKKFFRAAEGGRWDETTNWYAVITSKYNGGAARPTNSWSGIMSRAYASLSPYGLAPTNYWPSAYGPQWRPIENVQWAIFQMKQWNPELFSLYASNLMASIPTGSVFVGGSAPGYFIAQPFTPVSGPDHAPSFFTITPNRLVDAAYYDYAKELYGTQIKIPGAPEIQTAYSQYIADVTQRAKQGRLKPGETYTNVGGVPAVSGMAAVMEINGFMLRDMFSNNPERDFVYDEDFQFDWTMPFLAPHGLLLKIRHSPVKMLTQADVEHDERYWDSIVRTLTGLEMNASTTLPQLCDFADIVYAHHELGRFHGIPAFGTNDIAQLTFARLRLSGARVYAWRAANGLEPEKPGMANAADYAFRQVFALCPRLKELDQYGWFLYEQKRADDLQTLIGAIERIDPNSPSMDYLKNFKHPP